MSRDATAGPKDDDETHWHNFTWLQRNDFEGDKFPHMPPNFKDGAVCDASSIRLVFGVYQDVSEDEEIDYGYDNYTADDYILAEHGHPMLSHFIE